MGEKNESDIFDIFIIDEVVIVIRNKNNDWGKLINISEILEDTLQEMYKIFSNIIVHDIVQCSVSTFKNCFYEDMTFDISSQKAWSLSFLEYQLKRLKNMQEYENIEFEEWFKYVKQIFGEIYSTIEKNTGTNCHYIIRIFN